MSVAEYGRLIRRGHRVILEYRRRYAHSRERVWLALTEPEELAYWFSSTIDGERALGAALTFRFEHVQVDPMHGEIVGFDPASLLEFSWGPDRLRFELEPDGHWTLMTLTVTLEELGKATRDGTGWHQSLRGPEASVLGPPQEWEDEYGNA